MLRSEAITIIKRGLGFRQTQDAAIISALQAAQRDLENGVTLPDWLLSYDAPITVTADTATFTFPTRFLRLHDDYEMYYVNSNSARVFIPRKNYTEAYTAYVASGEDEDEDVIDTTANGYPQVFVQRGRTGGILIPTPTVSFTAYLTCYVGATLLDSDVENAWLANSANYLIGLAGMKVAGALRDKGAMEVFGDMAKQGGRAHLGGIIEDELAGRPLIMGRNN